MENRYYIKKIIPFVKLLVETIESLERTNNNLTEHLDKTNSKLADKMYEYDELKREYDTEAYKLENEIKELKQKLNALYGKEEK